MATPARGRPFRSTLLTCAAVLLLMPGCTGHTAEARDWVGSSRPHDPPLRFGPELAIDNMAPALNSLDREPALNFDGRPPAAVLTGTTLVSVNLTGVAAVDTVTGERRWSVPVQHALDTPAYAAPIVAAAAPVPTVYAVVPVLEGKDTLRIFALDPATGARRWTTSIRLRGFLVGLDEITLVGADARTVVVAISAGGVPTTYAVDTTTRRVRWTAPNFAASTLDGPVLAGLRIEERAGEPSPRGTAAGVRIADGGPAWAAGRALTHLEAGPLGPGLMYVRGYDDRDSPSFSFLDPATGAVRTGRHPVVPAGGRGPLLHCAFDQRSTIICTALAGTAAARYHPTSRRGTSPAGLIENRPAKAMESDVPVAVVAFDATDLRQLWARSGTTAAHSGPHISAAWHGALYGRVEHHPVVLDARTGAVRSRAPGAVPLLVNQYAGVGPSAGHITVEDGVGAVSIYPATG